MYQTRNLITLSAFALATASLLTACGGGSSDAPALIAQPTLTVSAGSLSLRTSATTTLSASGGAGNGATSYAVASGSCTVSGTTLTAASSAGTCTVTATKAADSTYSAKTSSAITITVTSAPAVLNFSTGFAANNLTVEGGKYSADGGSNLLDWNCRPQDQASYACNAGTNGTYPTVAAAATDFYFYYQTASVPAALYSQIDIFAPNVTALSGSADTSGVQIDGQTSVSFKFGQNPEWVTSGATNFFVNLTLGKHYSVGGNACNIVLRAIVQSTISPAQAAANEKVAYTVPLNSFYVVQNCGLGSLTPTSWATALTSAVGGPVSQISIGGAGGGSAVSVNGADIPAHISGANMTTTGQYNTYPTTVSMSGGIRFQ